MATAWAPAVLLWWRGLQLSAKFNLSFHKQSATSTMKSMAERKI